MRIKCDPQFAAQNNMINCQKSSTIIKNDKTQDESGNSYPGRYNSPRHGSQICDKNGNNLLMIAPVIHGLSNRSGQSLQTGHAQNHFTAFSDAWIRGNRSANHFKLNRINSNTIKNSMTLVSNVTNGNSGLKRLKVEGEDEESGRVLQIKDSRGNNLSSITSSGSASNTQDLSSSSASQSSTISSVRKRAKISFGKESISDARNSGDRQ